MASEYTVPKRPSFTMPSQGTKFSRSVVEKVIAEVCEEVIGEDRTFVFEETQPLIKDICNEVQQRVVRLGYERYKMITHVVVAEAAQQGLRVASRCLWDPDTDNYASYTYSTANMHVSVVLFGAYWE
ncbi:dynein light chain [Strigomonas culicis]|uniref:Dynein light chain n=1 Tax=Strigomonas culicis TaxID=28005 RepID=S9UWV6_9TRYP|nr:dynein light chain [Strigomonas culicis]EPY33358.1 dynein light chain [Strigomonas culicis]|eukprot:EPY29557.1 dynein light chain [Strigomonas culicis]